MSDRCRCEGPGHCPVFDRNMDQAEFDICSGAVQWLRLRHVGEWLRPKMAESGRVCVFDGGAALDEHGIPIKRRGCGCNGQPPVIPMKKCVHPLHPDPMPEGCENRCTHIERV